MTDQIIMFISQLFNGLKIGSVYALVALGYTMVYGIIRLINFAHGDFIIRERRHFYLNIYPVEQRSAYPREIAGDICLRAGAFAGGMTVIAAFTWIHGANEHEIRGKCEFSADARYRYLAVLERLAQSLHGFAGKLGKLIEKEHSVVRK